MHFLSRQLVDVLSAKVYFVVEQNLITAAVTGEKCIHYYYFYYYF